PLFRSTGFQGIFAFADWHPGGFEPSFQGVEVYRFPSPEVHGVVSLIITVRQIDEIMGPHITPLSRIIQIDDLLKMLTIVRQQCIIKAQDPCRLPMCSRKTRQEVSSCVIHRIDRYGTFSQQAIQAPLMAYVDDKESVDTVDCRVFRDDQPTE